VFIQRRFLYYYIFFFVLADRPEKNTRLDKFFQTSCIEPFAYLHYSRYHLLRDSIDGNCHCTTFFQIGMAGNNMVSVFCCCGDGRGHFIEQNEIEIAIVDKNKTDWLFVKIFVSL